MMESDRDVLALVPKDEGKTGYAGPFVPPKNYKPADPDEYLEGSDSRFIYIVRRK